MDRSELIKNEAGGYEEREFTYSPLWWHTRGLRQTASGFGRKLTSSYKVHYAGKLRRIYINQTSNAGTAFVMVKGRRVSL